MNCAECNKYKSCGHNYRRMCGNCVRPGGKNVRVAQGYTTAEKYCGYCGKKREECSC